MSDPAYRLGLAPYRLGLAPYRLRPANPRRMPSIVIPFALLGLAVGWLWAGLLSMPPIRAAWAHNQPRAAVLAAGAGALVGALVDRYCGRGAARTAPVVRRILYASFVIAGGTVAGLVAQPTAWGALAGAGGAAAFLPLGAMILAASRRAARARLGSIVAGADRRAVDLLLAATLAVASVPAALGGIASAEAGPAPPYAIACAIGAAAIVLALILADAVALLRLRRARVAAATMAARDPGDALRDAGVPRVDLGLGRAVRARIARGAAAYRTPERAVELIVGSPRRARAAVVRAIGRGVVALAVVSAALAVHAVALGPRGPAAMRALLCDLGDRWQCASLYLEPACDRGDGASCRTLAGLYESDVARVPDRAFALFARGCALGDGPSCDALPDPPLLRAVDACMRGAHEDCVAAASAFEDAGDLVRADYFQKRAGSIGTAAWRR